MSYAQGVLNLDENDIILSTSPFYTSQGLMERIFFPIYSGASVIMAPQEASGLDLLNILRTHKVTVLFSTPDVYNNILKEAAEKHEATSLPSLRACVSTAQTLPLSTQLNWKKSFDIDILNALSSTEELYAFITNRPGHSRAGSVGQAAPGYAIRLEGRLFVLMTDLGHVTDEAIELAREADSVVIESNYDMDMLLGGDYPQVLKDRISHGIGHLSNDACAQAIGTFLHPGLKNLFLCHLSGNNNTPELAYASARAALMAAGVDPGTINLRVLKRGIASPLLVL
jgi:hypothetical protein